MQVERSTSSAPVMVSRRHLSHIMTSVYRTTDVQPTAATNNLRHIDPHIIALLRCRPLP
jgi:hypothetical protein